MNPHVCLDHETIDGQGRVCGVCGDRPHWSDELPARFRGGTREQMDAAFDRMVAPVEAPSRASGA